MPSSNLMQHPGTPMMWIGVILMLMSVSALMFYWIVIGHGKPWLIDGMGPIPRIDVLRAAYAVFVIGQILMGIGVILHVLGH